MKRSAQPDPLDTPRPNPLLSERKTIEPLQSSHFKHSQLDLEKRSIRLVRVLADKTRERYIQCEIRHASIDDTYVCLSYVWGQENAGCWILLEGRRFWIRDNLWHFLDSARKKPHIRSEWLWIDALCIDQTNNTEKNHQVQQMGSIYSSAAEVICWLGMSYEIEWFFDDILSGRLLGLREADMFFDCEYWDRAWITQEYALAYRRTFMARDSEIDSEQIPPLRKKNTPFLPEGMTKAVDPKRQTRLELSSNIRGKSLIYLLENFQAKKCKHPRDRIFSLLAVCGDASGLKVDYVMPPQELVGNVLQTCKKSFCLCSIHLLDRCLDIQGNPRIACDHDAVSHPFAYMTLPVRFHHAFPGVGSSTAHVSSGRKDDAPYRRVSIRIPLDAICDRYGGDVTVKIYASITSHYHSWIGKIGYRQKYSRDSFLAPVKQYLTHKCTGRVHSDTMLCTIHFSLDALLDLARLSQPRGCCWRGASEDRHANGSAKTPMLFLCSELSE